jgi:hypothetical protein
VVSFAIVFHPSSPFEKFVRNGNAGCTTAMIGLPDPISTRRRVKVGRIHCPYI